jgi:cytochrome c oxidase subunit 2
VRIRTAAITALAATALVVTGLIIGTQVNLLPEDASSNAAAYDSLFQVLFSIGTMLFIGILVVLVYSLVRFRRRPGELADGPAIEGNLPLEIVWTAIPAVVILFVGIYSYDIYDRMGGMVSLDHGAMDHSAMNHGSLAPGTDPVAMELSRRPRIWGGIGPAAAAVSTDQAEGIDPLTVDLTAMQFAFIFQYPDAGITAGELHVPLGQPVQLRMEARDVIHAFWVPQFRLKQDVIPGQPTLLSFTPTRAGTYPLICAELCGPYHGGMRTNVVVHQPADYQAWVSQNRPAATA